MVKGVVPAPVVPESDRQLNVPIPSLIGRPSPLSVLASTGEQDNRLVGLLELFVISPERERKIRMAAACTPVAQCSSDPSDFGVLHRCKLSVGGKVRLSMSAAVVRISISLSTGFVIPQCPPRVSNGVKRSRDLHLRTVSQHVSPSSVGWRLQTYTSW